MITIEYLYHHEATFTSALFPPPPLHPHLLSNLTLPPPVLGQRLKVSEKEHLTHELQQLKVEVDHLWNLNHSQQTCRLVSHSAIGPNWKIIDFKGPQSTTMVISGQTGSISLSLYIYIVTPTPEKKERKKSWRVLINILITLVWRFVVHLISRWALSISQWQLHSATVCFWADPLCSGCMWLWVSDSSFQNTIILWPRLQPYTLW